MSQGSYVEDDFQRDTAYIEDRITADGEGEGEWPVEPGRYRLVVARGADGPQPPRRRGRPRPPLTPPTYCG